MLSSPMSDTPNLVLGHLRAIREELREVRVEQREQRSRLGAIERTLAHLERDGAESRAEIGVRFDRVLDRLERLDRVLEIIPG